MAIGQIARRTRRRFTLMTADQKEPPENRRGHLLGEPAPANTTIGLGKYRAWKVGVSPRVLPQRLKPTICSGIPQAEEAGLRVMHCTSSMQAQIQDQRSLVRREGATYVYATLHAGSGRMQGLIFKRSLGGGRTCHQGQLLFLRSPVRLHGMCRAGVIHQQQQQ